MSNGRLKPPALPDLDKLGSGETSEQPHPNPYLNTVEATDYLRLSPRTLQKIKGSAPY